MAKTAIISPKMIISYPNLFEPKANLSGALKYSCSLLIDKSDTKGIATLKAAIEAATDKGKASIWSNKVPKFRHEAIRDGDAELEAGDKSDKIYEGKFFLNATSNNSPGVVDAQAKAIFDQDLVYAGCIVRAQLNAFPYKNSGNYGVAWGLNGIMFIKDGPRLDGRVPSEQAFAEYAKVDEDSEELM